jgi:two-component system, NtrC family, response regulator AtoC
MNETILVCDDNKRIYESLKPNFDYYGYKTRYAESGENAAAIILSEKIELILLDIMLGDHSGVEVLKSIKQLHYDIPVIMITGHATVETAVESMKLGAFDYVKKPLDFERLLKIVETAIKMRKLSAENISLKKILQDQSPPLYYRNKEMQAIIKRAEKIAQTNIPVLITGENGSGKELVADYIHSNSSRLGKKMAKINCAAFPESLLDNELFGHEQGAYTGADSEFKGIFERAHGSSLFLDEIGDMPLTIQAKILRVLQNNEVRRIGGSKTLTVDVRFIAATNRNLDELIQKGKFRTDLFYRLNAAVLNVPSLKNRRDDIASISEYFLKESSANYEKKAATFTKEVMNFFTDYNWPGNIRELKNVINYAVAISSDNKIKLEDLPPSLQPIHIDSPFHTRETMERNLIIKTLQQQSFNKKKTAEALNMSRKTLYAKISKYDIKTN